VTPTGHLPGLLGPLETTARALWFLAWSILAGAAAWSWIFGPGAGGLDADHRDIIDALWRRGLRLGWLWVGEATLLGLLVGVFAAGSGAAPSAVTGEMGAGWLVSAVALCLLRRPVQRLAGGTGAGTGPIFELDRRAVSWLVGALALGEVLTVPTRSKVAEVVHVAIGATHVASAGLWMGSLALFVVLLRSRRWRGASSGGAPMRAVVRPVAETAARAAAVLVVSGLAAAAISSPGLGRWASEYSWLLAAKAAVLVVAAAIAWRQWIVAHSPGSATRGCRAMTVEAGALFAAGALAAVLVGVDPVPAASAAPAPASAAATSTPSCMFGAPRTSCDAATIASVVAETTAGALDATLPHLCTGDATRPKAYAYFVCLETVGQAIAAAAPTAPSPALAHCQAFPDAWSEQQCGSGVFARLLSAERASPAAADAHASDPVWPCPTVSDVFKDPCYLSVTSRVLWLNGGDVRAAFSICDKVESASRPVCYQGMGRDITSRSGYQPAAIVDACGQAGALGPDPCIAGAVRTLVYTRHAEGAAALCGDAPPTARASCEEQRRVAIARL
jgi:hypothetical protein